MIFPEFEFSTESSVIPVIITFPAAIIRFFPYLYVKTTEGTGLGLDFRTDFNQS